MNQRARQFLGLVFLLCVIGVSFIGFSFYKASVFRTEFTQRVIIRQGFGVRDIGHILYQNKLIQSPFIFQIYLRFTGDATKLKAGEYEIVAGSRMQDVIELLLSGKTVRYAVTIPEGYNLREVCQRLEKNGAMSFSVCDSLVHDTSFLREVNGAQSLEGYLFPETYLFEKHISPRQIIQAMVDQFYKKITPERLAEANQHGLSLHQWVTFASVVEKETAIASERPLIAGVFYNRLRLGMLLQTDPTVIYGISNFDGNLTKKHLMTDTPYNTYTRAGLPVGPIANPGLESLLAVLRPVQTEALYFVAKGEGRHYFSKSLEQHNEAVRYFIRKKGAPPTQLGEEDLLK